MRVASGTRRAGKRIVEGADLEARDDLFLR
jgi:hypothetical protein